MTVGLVSGSDLPKLEQQVGVTGSAGFIVGRAVVALLLLLILQLLLLLLLFFYWSCCCSCCYSSVAFSAIAAVATAVTRHVSQKYSLQAQS